MKHLLSLDLLSELLLKTLRCLPDDCLLHLQLPLSVRNVPLLRMIDDFGEGTEGPILAFALVVFVLLGPFNVGLPLHFEFWRGDFVTSWEQIVRSGLLSNEVLGLARHDTADFERAVGSRQACCVRELHLIVIRPVLPLLIEEAEAHGSWFVDEALILLPVETVGSTGELRQLLAMDAKNLVTELLRHVLDHILSAAFFEQLSIHRSALSLVGDACDAVLALIDAAVAVDMSRKHCSELMLVTQRVLPSLVQEQTFGHVLRLINPFQSRIGQLFTIDVLGNRSEASDGAFGPLLLSVLLYDRGIHGVGDILLRPVVVFEAHVFYRGNFLVLFVFLALNIVLLLHFPVS